MRNYRIHGVARVAALLGTLSGHDALRFPITTSSEEVEHATSWQVWVDARLRELPWCDRQIAARPGLNPFGLPRCRSRLDAQRWAKHMRAVTIRLNERPDDFTDEAAAGLVEHVARVAAFLTDYCFAFDGEVSQGAGDD